MTTKTVQHTPGPWTTSRDAVPDWHTQFTVCAESDGERESWIGDAASGARMPSLRVAQGDEEYALRLGSDPRTQFDL